MKIAIVSEDGKTVSRHFGRGTQYVVVSTAGDMILDRKTRAKVGRIDPSCGLRDGGGCRCLGDDDSSFDRHRPMVLNILDCDAVLAGGMGWGAYAGLRARGILPVVTDVDAIGEAVKLYLRGDLPNLAGRQ